MTCVCAGTALDHGLLVDSADQVVVTGSKDGKAVLWEIDHAVSAFRLKCVLAVRGAALELLDDRSRVNDVACFLVEPQLVDPAHLTPQQSGPPAYREAFVVTAGSSSGVQVWLFQHHSTPVEPGGSTAVPCVDRLNAIGVPERHQADGSCAHICGECGHNAEVLSLALAPPRTKQLGEQPGFGFSFFTGSTDGRARLWDVWHPLRQPGVELPPGSLKVVEAMLETPTEQGAQDDPTMAKDRNATYAVTTKYRLRHARHSEVTCVSVAHLPNGHDVVLTGDSLGTVKLWRYGPEPELLHYWRWEAEVVQSAKVTPRLAWHRRQYIIASIGSASCYAWPMPTYDLEIATASRQSNATRASASMPPSPLAADALEGGREVYFFRARSLAFVDWVRMEEERSTPNRRLLKRARPAATSRVMPANAVNHVNDPGLFAISPAPDGTAKMWHLITRAGHLTTPISKKSTADDTRPTCEIVQQFRHAMKVNDVVVCQLSTFFDEAGVGEGQRRTFNQPVLLTASDDRSCTMWRLKGGTPLRAFRAAKLREMFIPLILLATNFLQLSSFAFAADIAWRDGGSIEPSRFITRLLAGDVNMLLKDLFEGAKRALTAASVGLATLLATLFDLIVLLDVMGHATRRIIHLEELPDFRKEIRNGQTGFNRTPMGPLHRSFWRWRRTRQLTALGLQLASTICLVPLCKAALKIFHCNSPNVEPWHLEWAPKQDCYDALHWVLVVLVSAPLLVYFCLTQPYTLAQGNPWVVARKDLLNVRQWRRICEQQAGLVYLGPVHVNPRNFVFVTLAENFTKVASPALGHIVWRPVPRLCSMLALHLLNLLVLSIKPPFRCRSVGMLAVGFKVATLLAYISAICAEAVGKEDSEYVAIAWYVSVGLCALVCGCVFERFAHWEEQVEERRTACMLRDDLVSRAETNGTQWSIRRRARFSRALPANNTQRVAPDLSITSAQDDTMTAATVAAGTKGGLEVRTSS